jgi:hypothetical protein
VGERVTAVARRFIGAPYVPRTLDPPGPERLVINLRAFDCVTLVESVLALSRVVVADPPAAGLEDPGPWMDRYAAVLTELRYREGEVAGYPSRLHYFSEWLDRAAERGYVEPLTRRLGGRPDPEPPTFMTEHRSAYDQLADTANLRAIREVEARLVSAPRFRIPQEEVAAVEDSLRSGDVIAATSTLPGLDVAHTGFAVEHQGRIHLLHAPLVGDSVQLSPVPLARRLQRIEGQDGIMAARPIEPEF